MGWHIIESVTLDKPPYGTPCNGCGMCCIAQVCELGLELGDEINCLALIQKQDGSFSCGLVENPYRFRREKDLATWKKIDEMSEGRGEQSLKQMYADMLGTGRGCDSDDEDIKRLVRESTASSILEFL